MINPLWSIVLTTLGAFGLFLVFRFPKSWLGPTWSIVLQAVWLAYGLATQQWGFIASAFMYAGANTYGLLARRNANAQQADTSTTTPDQGATDDGPTEDYPDTGDYRGL